MVAVGMVLAYALGVLTGVAVFQYTLRLAARYQKVGHIEPPVVAEKNPVPASVEGAASRRVLQDAVNAGADEIMRMAEAQGERITRDEAERDARQLLEQVHGAGALGGVN